MVVAARGSGETPQANWQSQDAYASDQWLGAGEDNYFVYKKLVADNPNLHWSLMSVMYPAPPVSQLLSSPTTYIEAPKTGAITALNDIQNIETYCGGGVKILALGFSSGAWLIHRLVYFMKYANLVNRVVGVGFFGDPLFEYGLAIDRDYRLQDLEVGAAYGVDTKYAGVPKSIGSVTDDACFPGDPVCQSPNINLVECYNGDPACPHFNYVPDEATNVEQFLNQNMPTSSVWPTITSRRAPNGIVQSPYSWTPTVKPTARTTYQWSESGILPPGLRFSTTTGAVTGTPTKAGIYGFSVTATSTQQRTASQFESVVINSGGPLAIGPSSLPPATAGAAYKVTLSGSGGYLPYTWHATGDALSHGMQFTVINQDTSTATLSGTPDLAGTYSLSITLSDAKGARTIQSYSLTVASAPTPGGSGTWTATQAPLPPDADTSIGAGLNSVACSSSTCVAFGSYTDSGGSEQGVLLTGAGSSWTATEPPLPPDAYPNGGLSLDADTCVSASECVVVGDYASSGPGGLLMLTGSGSSWTAAEAPLPANASPDSGTLASVACASASDCVAAGDYIDASDARDGLLETGSGSSWTAIEAPLPTDANPKARAHIDSVACPSTSSCVAVGYYTDSSGNTQRLLLTGSGSSWTATQAPLPDNAASSGLVGSGLTAVACASTTSCVAIGSYIAAGSTQEQLLVTGAGSSWTATQAPVPANASAPYALISVTCASMSACLVVGDYVDSSGKYQGLLLSGLGSSWTATEAPLPANADTTSTGSAAVVSVACLSTLSCVAVGYYTDSSGKNQGLLLTGSQSSWIAAEAPVPSNAAPSSDAGLHVVACSSSTCTGLGGYTDSAGVGQEFLLTGSG
jgi:hypothetical protein